MVDEIQPKKKKKPTLTDALNEMEKAKQIGEIGRAVPGASPFIDEADIGIEAAEEGVGIFKKIKSIFSKKK